MEGIKPEIDEDSLQWLAHHITDDSRFASATVRFWWPAVFGTEIKILPEDPDGPDYDQRLSVYNAQESLLKSLADKFVSAEYRLKELLADMLMSSWYRVSQIDESQLTDSRSVALETIGGGRLLSPEELDRKNFAVFGTTWSHSFHWPDNKDQYYEPQTILGDNKSSFKTFYGGTDSNVVTRRNRSMTPLMRNVSEAMATDLACAIVGLEFSLPQSERTVFNLVEFDTKPGVIGLSTNLLPGQVESQNDWINQEIISLPVVMPGGSVKISISDLTTNNYDSTDGLSSNADLLIKKIIFLQNDEFVLQIDGQDLPATDGFNSDTWTDDTGKIHNRGDIRENAWWLHEGSWVDFFVRLPAGEYTVELHFGTSLKSNNLNETIKAYTTFTALTDPLKTTTGIAVKNQMHALYLRATNRELPETRAEDLTHELISYADFHRKNVHGSSWVEGGICEPIHIWKDWWEMGHESRVERFRDPERMVRAWTMIVHSILSSYLYLHD